MAASSRGLKVRGRALWKSLHEDYEFDSHEETLVFETCRVVDVIADLADSVSSDGLMIVGSMGQKVLNPAVAEMRQQQMALSRLVGMLNLGSADTGSAAQMITATSLSAKRAAEARWSKKPGVSVG